MDNRSGFRFFIALSVLGKWSAAKIGGGLSRQNGYWVGCGDRIVKRGVELMELLTDRLIII